MIRRAVEADLNRLADGAEMFYASSRFLKNFDIERFVAVWIQLLKNESGVIMLLVDRSGVIIGALGGVIYPDLYNGVNVATEFFWFVDPEKRGGGVELYKAFEAWARERGCAQIRMVHLTDLMSEKLSTVYSRLGFEPAEIHYVKELTR